MQMPRRKIWDLAGEGQTNDDGTQRQHVLSVLYPGEPLILERQPDNPHDANAVAVRAGRHVIGYITRADAPEVAALIDAGIPHRAQLHELTGGIPGYDNFGAKICIAWRDGKLLDPQPIKPEQTLHASTPAKPGSAGGFSTARQIMALVAFVALCILVAALI